MFAVPFLTFSILMGVAIISMMLFLAAKGFPAPAAAEGAMGVYVLAALYLTFKFLKEVREI